MFSDLPPKFHNNFIGLCPCTKKTGFWRTDRTCPDIILNLNLQKDIGSDLQNCYKCSNIGQQYHHPSFQNKRHLCVGPSEIKESLNSQDVNDTMIFIGHDPFTPQTICFQDTDNPNLFRSFNVTKTKGSCSSLVHLSSLVPKLVKKARKEQKKYYEDQKKCLKLKQMMCRTLQWDPITNRMENEDNTINQENYNFNENDESQVKTFHCFFPRRHFSSKKKNYKLLNPYQNQINIRCRKTNSRNRKCKRILFPCSRRNGCRKEILYGKTETSGILKENKKDKSFLNSEECYMKGTGNSASVTENKQDPILEQIEKWGEVSSSIFKNLTMVLKEYKFRQCRQRLDPCQSYDSKQADEFGRLEKWSEIYIRLLREALEGIMEMDANGCKKRVGADKPTETDVYEGSKNGQSKSDESSNVANKTMQLKGIKEKYVSCKCNQDNTHKEERTETVKYEGLESHVKELERRIQKLEANTECKYIQNKTEEEKNKEDVFHIP